jgi:hypothetical protein
MEAVVAAEFWDKTKKRPDGRIEMRSRGFSMVLTQKNPSQ